MVLIKTLESRSSIIKISIHQTESMNALDSVREFQEPLVVKESITKETEDAMLIPKKLLKEMVLATICAGSELVLI